HVARPQGAFVGFAQALTLSFVRVVLKHWAYQTLQILSAGRAIGWFCLQEKACEDSDMFTTTPFMRYLENECGSVMARTRMSSGLSLEQSHCANPIKKRCSRIRPSTG